VLVNIAVLLFRFPSLLLCSRGVWLLYLVLRFLCGLGHNAVSAVAAAVVMVAAGGQLVLM